MLRVLFLDGVDRGDAIHNVGRITLAAVGAFNAASMTGRARTLGILSRAFGKDASVAALDVVNDRERSDRPEREIDQRPCAGNRVCLLRVARVYDDCKETEHQTDGIAFRIAASRLPALFELG